MTVLRYFLRRAFPGESPVYRQFIGTVVAAFLWFAVGLSFLSLVGLTVIAGALGTATGFLALGVSYALSGMLADAVAGVYLLRDPDFQPGDTVTVDDVTGEVVAIELRKTRLPWRATRWSGRTRTSNRSGARTASRQANRYHATLCTRSL